MTFKPEVHKVETRTYTLDQTAIEQIIVQYFADHLGEDIGRDNIDWTALFDGLRVEARVEVKEKTT